MLEVMHNVSTADAFIRRPQNHNVYMSDTYASGGARGTFCHSAERCGECRVLGRASHLEITHPPLDGGRDG